MRTHWRAKLSDSATPSSEACGDSVRGRARSGRPAARRAPRGWGGPWAPAGTPRSRWSPSRTPGRPAHTSCARAFQAQGGGTDARPYVGKEEDGEKGALEVGQLPNHELGALHLGTAARAGNQGVTRTAPTTRQRHTVLFGSEVCVSTPMVAQLRGPPLPTHTHAGGTHALRHRGRTHPALARPRSHPAHTRSAFAARGRERDGAVRSHLPSHEAGHRGELDEPHAGQPLAQLRRRTHPVSATLP